MSQNGTKKNWTDKNAHDLATFVWQNPNATQESIAQAIGVSRNTLYRYWQDPDFEEAVNHLSRLFSSKHKNAVDSVVIKQAKKGDLRAAELFYKLRGELTERREHNHRGDLDINVIRTEIQQRMAESEDDGGTDPDTK